MLNSLFTKIVGSRNERLVTKMGKAVERINALDESVKALSAEQMTAKTAELRERHAAGESLDALLPEAFALVREASVRTLGLRHFDVQLSIFGLRMLGLFVILPVFALYARELEGGDDLTLVGFALGAYGFTQAILQIPFGRWSDRVGRKPALYVGLLIFAAGSLVAGYASTIHSVILGRILQGAGAISADAIAMAADLTRDEHRTKAMAIIGSTIGVSFAVSLVIGPWLDRLIGVAGIFYLIGALALAAMAIVAGLPAPPESATRPGQEPASFGEVLRDRELLRPGRFRAGPAHRQSLPGRPPGGKLLGGRNPAGTAAGGSPLPELRDPGRRDRAASSKSKI